MKKKYCWGSFTITLLSFNSIMCLSSQKVLRLCVYALFFAYGVSVIVGASSSFQLGKLVNVRTEFTFNNKFCPVYVVEMCFRSLI